MIRATCKRVNIGEIDDAILDALGRNRSVERAVDRFINDIEKLWHVIWVAEGPHPYQTGDYEGHIKKKKLTLKQKLDLRKHIANSRTVGIVYNDSDIAWLIEEGTGPDKPGSNSSFGPNTPTRAFKIAEQVTDAAKNIKV